MAKKKSGYELWKEVEAQQTQRKAEGKIHFKEDSRATRVQYSDPNYTGRSEEKSYKWEKELLDPLKFKGVRSYNDKFKTWAAQQGMTDGQAAEFRKYMDFQEDSQWQEPELTDKEDDPETFKDESVRQNQKLNYARGMHIKGDNINNIINSIGTNFQNNSARQAEVRASMEEAKATSKAAQQPQEKAQGTSKPQSDNKIVDGILKALEIIDRPGDAVRTGIKNKVEGESFWKGAKDGFTGKQDTTGTELNKVLGFDPNSDSTDSKIADILGELTTSSTGMLGRGLSYLLPEEQREELINRLGTETAGMGSEIVLDPLNLIGTGVVSRGSDVLGRLAKVDGQLPTFTGAPSPNVVDNLAPQPTSLLVNPNQADPMFEQLMSQANPARNVVAPQSTAVTPTPQAPRTLDDFTTSEIPPIEMPSTLSRSAEDIFVDEQLAPFRESQQAQANAQAEWQTIKQVQDEAQRIKDYYGKIIPDGSSKDLINEIPPQFRGAKGGKGNDIYRFAEEEGFPNADAAIEYLKNLDASSKTRLKDLNTDDGLRIADEQWQALEEAARQSYRQANPQADEMLDPYPNADGLDEALRFLDETAATRSSESINSEIVNNSQAIDNTLDNLNPNSERGKFLMRLDSQQHAPTDGSTLVETDPTVTTTSPIDMQSNLFKRLVSKHYNNYVNRNHQAKVAEVQILKNAGELDAAKKVQKYGSDFDKAVGNELAAGSAAKNLLDRNFSALEQSVKDLGPDKGKAMAEAMDYQLAMNLDWIRQSDPDYTLPNGWDWGRVNSIINKGVDGKYKPFTDAMYALNQEVRDVMLDYGLITKDVHKILGDNPFYVPMARDISQLLDNIDVGMSQRAGNRRRGAGAGIIYGLKGGDAETFIKNPLDTLVERTFTMYQNAMRNDTAQQALRLAEIDDGSLGLVKKISQKQYKEGGGLMVLRDGKREYIRLQQDLQKMLDENQTALDLGKLGKATQLFAGLKTRSLEYQSAAIVRDLGTSYLTSQIKDPIRYTREFFKSLGNKSMSAKEAGAYFDRAHNDHTGGVDPKRLLAEYQKRTGNVKSFKVNDSQSWKDFGNAIKRTVDKIDVARRLGQVTDEIPRDIEVRETERLFMKKHGAEMSRLESELAQLNQQIEAAQGAPDFSPQTSGIDDVIKQRDGIESQLRQFKQNLRREQVYRGRDVIDYSRVGGGKMMKNYIRPWVIFANTTIQSKDKVIRSFIERPGSTLAKMTGLLGPMVAWQQMNFDNMNEKEKSVYDNLPDYMKQYNYVFVNDGDVFAVPKLHELALVSNPIEAALKGEDQNEAMRLLVKELVPYQGGNFAQGLVRNADGSITYRDNTQWPSTVGSPMQDIEANKKMGFNDKPISFGGYYKGADAAANEWTLDVFKRAIGDNPGADFTQYGIEQYGGDYGKYLNQILNANFGRNDNKVEEALRYLNPAQDRVFLEDGTIDIGGIKIPVRTPAQETKK